MPSKLKAQDGITLIEVLVTVLVLAIGGLGIASMQLAGLKYTNGAYARTQSVILANDMVNRIKSNRSKALEGIGGGNSPYAIDNFGAQVTSTRDCALNICDTDDLAVYDLSTWLEEIARVLPAGQGQITAVEQNNPNGITEPQFTISLRWRQVANSTDQDATTDAQIVTVAYRVSI